VEPQRLEIGEDIFTLEYSNPHEKLIIKKNLTRDGLLRTKLVDINSLDILGNDIVQDNQATSCRNTIITDSSTSVKVKVLEYCTKNSSRLCLSSNVHIYVTVNGASKFFALSQQDSTEANLDVTHFKIQRVNISFHWVEASRNLSIYDVPTNAVLRVIRPKQNSPNMFRYSSLSDCNNLQIDSITIQPSLGALSINPDQTTLKYSPPTIADMSRINRVSSVIKVSIRRNGNIIDSKLGSIVFIFVKKTATNSTSNVCQKKRKPLELFSSGRSFDGSLNNVKDPHWGRAHEDLIRLIPNSYKDGISKPTGGCPFAAMHGSKMPSPHMTSYEEIQSDLPSPRLISNILFAQTGSVPSSRNMSDFTVHFGQFVSHDFDHSSPIPLQKTRNSSNEQWFPIKVPKGDVHFDRYASGKENLPFFRSAFNTCTGFPGKPRQQINMLTSFIDANMVYGASKSECDHLRLMKGGLMRTSDNDMPPKNTEKRPMANPLKRNLEELFITGDKRVNVQIGLITINTIFLREHNRLAKEYHRKHPLAPDEVIFQYARRMVIAELQSIIFNEYLPALLGGKERITPYHGYNNTVNSGVSNVFATAGFRFGHSQVNSMIHRLDQDGQMIPEGHVALRETYFSPHRLVREGGMDPILRGMYTFSAQEVDTRMVDEMRNFLFRPVSPDGKTGMDLAAVNIQRGRDHGIPDLNSVRRFFNLKEYKSFSEITSDEEAAENLQYLYKDINKIDLWVGGLVETHIPGGEVGETFAAILVDQFTRARDGDRFWYENTLSEEEITKVEQMSMSRLIKYNSGVHECVDDVFFASKHCQRSSKYQCFPKGICDPRSKPRGFCNPKPTTKPVIPDNKPLQDEHEEKFLVPALIVITCILFIICILVLVVIARQKLCKARNSGPTIDGTVVANFEARTDGQTEVNLPPPYQ